MRTFPFLNAVRAALPSILLGISLAMLPMNPAMAKKTDEEKQQKQAEKERKLQEKEQQKQAEKEQKRQEKEQEKQQQAELERQRRAQAQAFPANVNGRTVTAVVFGRQGSKLGTYEQTGSNTWIETNAQGRTTFNFVETNRDDWTAYLLDSSRNVRVNLDLHRKQAFYADSGNPNPRPLYELLSASANPVPVTAQTPVATPPVQTVAPAAPMSVPPPAVVNGYQVNEVTFAQQGRALGTYKQTGPKSWMELPYSSSGARFTFDEVGRDEWSVYLYDASRKVRLQLDLHRKQVLYSQLSDKYSRPIYELVNPMVVAVAGSPPAPAPVPMPVPASAPPYAPDPAGQVCANENQHCSFTGTAEVSYGANGKWVSRTVTNGVECTNGVFGDPNPGVVKKCIVSNLRHSAPVAPTPSPSQNVTVYQDCNYGGYSVTLPYGSYDMGDLARLGVKNDDLSAIRVPSGTVVYLYEHAGYSGRSWRLTSDNSCFIHSGFNDIVSSIRIVRQGQSVPVATPSPTSTPAPAPAPAAQPVSAAVTNGYSVKSVRFGNQGQTLGYYRQSGFQKWIEQPAARGGTTFYFDETNRDEWSVYLLDRSRNVRIQLDLHRKQVFYSDSNSPSRPQYSILEASK